MTSDKLFKIIDGEMRNGLLEMAAAFSRKPKVQDDLFVKALFVIGEEPHDKTRAHYIGIAYAVMRHNYEVYYMPEPNSKPSNDAGIQRANRKLRYELK